jgi:Na+/melibiose symporter-like transporter
MPPATAGWQQKAGKPQLQIPFSELSPDTFFFFVSLPLMREQPNYTCKLKNLLRLSCIWTWDTWWVFFCVCVCVVLFYFMHPLWWDNYRTTSEAPSPGLETDRTTKLLRLKLHCIWLGGFFVFWFFGFFKFSIFSFYVNTFLYTDFSFIYLFFIFILIFIFLFLIFNPLSSSLMSVQLTVD